MAEQVAEEQLPADENEHKPEELVESAPVG